MTGLGSDHVADWVAYNAGRFPDRPALEDVGSGTVVTWGALDERVGRLAGALRGRFNVQAGDRVVVVADNDVRFVGLLLATMRIGAVFVPMNWRLSRSELVDCCADAEPALVVHDKAWQEFGTRLGESAPAVACWDCGEDGADLERAADDADPVAPDHSRSLRDPVQILYTSGTTGTPKGAVITHGGLLANCLNVSDLCEVWGRGERLLTAMPLFHAGGLNGLAIPVLRAGGTLALTQRFDPDAMVRLLADPSRRYTHFAGVPVMFQAMVAAGLPGRFPAGIHAQVGGGYLPPELVAEYGERGLALSSAYGSTEMGPLISAVPSADAARKPGSCGYPVRHTTLRIVGEDGADVAEGESGEAWVRGPAITTGYWRGAGADAFVDGWFRTGDGVRRDEEGFVYITGRFKDMYKSGGENVFAAEVENVLQSHPDIAEVAVIGVPDARWGEVGRAIIVPRPGTTVDLPVVEAHCHDRLARYKVPKHVVLVDALPRNVTGKVVKAEIRERYGAENQQ